MMDRGPRRLIDAMRDKHPDSEARTDVERAVETLGGRVVAEVTRDGAEILDARDIDPSDLETFFDTPREGA